MNQCTSISIVSLVLMGGALTVRAADYLDETTAMTVFASDSVSVPYSQSGFSTLASSLCGEHG